VQDVNERGHEQIVIFVEEKLFNQKKQIFLGEKAFFPKQKWRFSPFKTQDINLNRAPDMAYNKFSLNYEL